MAAEGARVVPAARGEDEGRDVEARLRAAGAGAVFGAADMTDALVTGDATLPVDGGATAG